MKLNWNFQRGEVAQIKKPSVDISCNKTFPGTGKQQLLEFVIKIGKRIVL